MKRLLFLLIIIFLIPNIIFSQGWIKYYGNPLNTNEYVHEVQQTTDGGYLLMNDNSTVSISRRKRVDLEKYFLK